jgi:transcriptional regulator with XRE-family HTH domain
MSNDICVQFGKRLRQLRLKKSCRKKNYYRFGMDVSYVSEVENGKKEPCLRKIKNSRKHFAIDARSLTLATPHHDKLDLTCLRLPYAD